MNERERFLIPYQTALAIAKILEIDDALLFDDFVQFMDFPYNDKLQEVRNTYGLKQATFAEKVDISLSIYSKCMSVSLQPPRKIYQRLEIVNHIFQNKYMKIQRICYKTGTLYCSIGTLFSLAIFL